MKEKIQALFEKTLGKKHPVDDLFLSASIHTQKGTQIFEGEIDSLEFSEEIKIGVTVSKNGKWSSSSLEQIDENLLDQTIEQAASTTVFTDTDKHRTLGTVVSANFPLHRPDPSLEKISLDELKEWGISMEERAKTLDARIQNIPHLGCGTTHLTRVLAHSQGLHITEETAFLQAGLQLLAKDPTSRIVSAYGSQTFPERKSFDPEQMVRKTVADVLSRLNPVPISSGTYPVIFDRKTSAQLLGTFSPVFSGELLDKGMAKLADQIDKPVASSIVQIVDEGFSGLAPHSFDAEGSPCPKKNIVEKGIFRTFLHNLYTASKTGVRTTGNAVGGVGQPHGVAPSNLSWEGLHTLTEEELLSQMGTGLLIQEINGASASPISGDFSYGALGQWIENGKRSHAIADFTIAGNFFTLLKEISGIGNSLEFFSPGATQSTGGRNLWVRSLTVSGS